MNRYICIHGHFYQPPRENPWLEEVEVQESAYPYHDWNERVMSECYAPNTASRILGEDKRIAYIVNNYESMSFNFGPTLLSWMERHTREDYQQIIYADKKSQGKFSGHGSALAQVYNHMIMPLSNTQDKKTQVYWGIKDFEYRFKRKPEGMWLAETAVDTETLETLSAYGIKFTILSPYQASRVKKIGDPDDEIVPQEPIIADENSYPKENKQTAVKEEVRKTKWVDVKGAKIDPSRAYLCKLPSGRSIHLFFYDGPMAQELAFGDLLKDGEYFARRLVSIFKDTDKELRLSHVATDGESYGHHRNFGDMALAYCFHHLQSEQLANITVYGEFLEKSPATHQVEIIENSSWSCAHGVERWKSDCGCRINHDLKWNQKWRAPLRETLDWLRDMVKPLYEESMRSFNIDPWRLRDEYIDVILNRSDENIENFFKTHVPRDLSAEDKVKLLKLLEVQRHAMLMYTSCGWFFDEISGIEATQVLHYAARVIQLSRDIFNADLEPEFVQRLQSIPSNIKEIGSGKTVYERYVRPSIIDLNRVVAHYAMSSLFEVHKKDTKIYCYTIENKSHDYRSAGRQRFVCGSAIIRSDITWETAHIDYAVIHLGDHNLMGGARVHDGKELLDLMQSETKKAFLKSDVGEVINLMKHHFGKNIYSLKHLFKNEQKYIFDKIVRTTLEDIESHYRHIYEQYYPLVQAKEDLNVTLPKALTNSIEFIVDRDFLNLLLQRKLNVSAMEHMVEEIKRWGFEIDQAKIALVAEQRINSLIEQLRKDPGNFEVLEVLEALLRLLSPLKLNIDLWRAQNIYFALSKELPQNKDAANHKWNVLFKSLGNYLSIQN